VSATGIHKMGTIDRRFVSPVGFSNGSAPFALKKPPPLVPSCLTDSCDATGPRGMTWLNKHGYGKCQKHAFCDTHIRSSPRIRPSMASAKTTIPAITRKSPMPS
jgi:hypothetical protein